MITTALVPKDSKYIQMTNAVVTNWIPSVAFTSFTGKTSFVSTEVGFAINLEPLSQVVAKLLILGMAQ